MSKFEHYRQNGQAVVKDVTARPVIDRLLTAPVHIPSTRGGAIRPGVVVSYSHARDGRWNRIGAGVGQVWDQASERGYWWIVANGGYVMAHQEDLSILEAADVPLEGVAS